MNKLINARRSLQGNVLGRKQDSSQFGWIGPILTAMANKKRTAASLQKGSTIFVADGYPLVLMHGSPSDLLASCRIAVSGKAKKVFAQSTHAGNADLDLTLTGTTSFGAKIRISDSITAYKYGGIRVQLVDGSTVINEVVVLANKPPAEIVLLAVSSAGGQASVVGVADLKVRFPNTNSAVSSTLQCFAESLNMKDIGEIKRA